MFFFRYSIKYENDVITNKFKHYWRNKIKVLEKFYLLTYGLCFITLTFLIPIWFATNTSTCEQKIFIILSYEVAASLWAHSVYCL